jgi:hypothetical protein
MPFGRIVDPLYRAGFSGPLYRMVFGGPPLIAEDSFDATEMKCPRSRVEFYVEADERIHEEIETRWNSIWQNGESFFEVWDGVRGVHLGFAEVAFRIEVDLVALSNFGVHHNEHLFFLERCHYYGNVQGDFYAFFL